MTQHRQGGLTLQQADEIVSEAKRFGWSKVVLNAERYGLTSTEMLLVWCRNDHMTPKERFPDFCWRSLGLGQTEIPR